MKTKRLTLKQRKAIAQEIKDSISGRCDITAKTIADIEAGRNFTASHPVHMRIVGAINAAKKGATV
jgi:hypothetical protein